MKQTEITKKAIRLGELVAEAKQIIEELEAYATFGKLADFKDLPITEIPMPKGPLRTRFLNGVWFGGNIKTLRDLLLHSASEVETYRNMGKKSVVIAQQAIKEAYGIDWK